MSQEHTLDISWEAIIKVFIAVFIFYILYLSRQIAFWFVFGLAISILLEPAINFLRKIHIPKILSATIVYLSIFGVLGVLIYISAPIFIFELRQFYQNLPDYFQKISPFLRDFGIYTSESLNDFSKVLTGGLAQSSKGIMQAVWHFLAEFLLLLLF
jgi:predicted PurR-regulated permease PerM